MSAVDPLNLEGILTPEDRVPAIQQNRFLYRDGLPIAALEAGELRRLAHTDLSDENLRTPSAREAAVLAGRRAPPPPSPFFSSTRH